MHCLSILKFKNTAAKSSVAVENAPNKANRRKIYWKGENYGRFKGCDVVLKTIFRFFVFELCFERFLPFPVWLWQCMDQKVESKEFKFIQDLTQDSHRSHPLDELKNHPSRRSYEDCGLGCQEWTITIWSFSCSPFIAMISKSAAKLHSKLLHNS